MPRFSGETHGPKLAELPIWSFCWIQTFNKKHADESICRTLSGHCQPSIRPVLFPNTICEFEEVTGLLYVYFGQWLKIMYPPKKNMILYISLYHILMFIIISPLQIEVCRVPPGSTQVPHQPLWQVACQPLWRCEGTISAWGRDSCASAAQGDR